MGRTDVRLMTVDNPFGMDPDDPNGLDDRLVMDPELHLPLDEPVKLLLRSKDVLHDFAVAEFRVKMDLVPGMVTYMWLTPTRTGEFVVLCEELCGVAHYTMRGRVIVETRDEFDTWLAQQPTFADRLAMNEGDAVTGQAQYAVCSACHGAQGEGVPAMNAPKLAGQEGWYIKKQIENFKNGLRGSHEDDVYGQQMAPMAATLVDEAAINNVIAYINTFPDEKPAATISGDVERGGDIFNTTCVSCHGANGEGVWSLNAPRMTGMDDWYLATQLANFKSGVRGGHRRDYYGEQMSFMARTLVKDSAINDVVAYMNTLEAAE